MQYFCIQFDNGQQLLQETFAGALLRYCDNDGVTATPPQGGSQNIGEVIPTFTPPPDPIITQTVTPTNETAPPEDTNSTPTPMEILGAPLRVMTYDEYGQVVRIDYPNSGTYQMLEYDDGRLRKITQITPIGITFVRHFYYDKWGRLREETQL